MGDRRNVIIKDGDDDVGVALYTHWAGTELPDTLRESMKRGKGRWDDAPYLARIIFCDMVSGSLKDETGYGLSAGNRLCEGSERDITLDVAQQQIQLGEGEKWQSFSDFAR